MNIQVSREELLKQLGYKKTPQPRLQNMVVETIGLLESLVKPRMAFKEIQGEEDVPPFFTGALLTYAGAATLGLKLENKVKTLFDEGKAVEAYILDTAGSVAITKAGDILWDEIKQDAEAKGFERGLRRTPGCRGIDLETQKWIFEKLADRGLGIKLTSSYMMLPRKSLSFLARFGGRVKGRLSCKGCPQYSACSLRG